MRRALLIALAVSFVEIAVAQSDWRPAEGRLMTRWAKDVSPATVWPEYPRPQLVRPTWQNLNGLWKYAIIARKQSRFTDIKDPILVPFAVESALSGVMRSVEPTEELWYGRTFTVPAEWAGQRVLLHFGAVDWEATVRVNWHEVGKHSGGYTPFTLDITKALNETGPQELVVVVRDPTDTAAQPRGKQVMKPHSIWYTPTTGIWQTVWLEPVPMEQSIKELRIEPDVDASAVHVTAMLHKVDRIVPVAVTVLDGGQEIASARGEAGEAITVKIEKPKLWSPESPFLYDLKVSLLKGDEPVDTVQSYFGMRKISLQKDAAGIPRLALNNQVLFQYGTLDQGYWPDGLYTAPNEEALRYDIDVTQKLGFNFARKHVKVEPDRWYYWCDKQGLMVWQDMPSSLDQSIGPQDPDIVRDAESAGQFKTELREMIDALRNHPCIVMWVPFNEGWGQFDTAGVAAWVKEYDPTRLVDSVTGWADRGVGDVHDIHSYPGPDMPPTEAKRAAVLGEFGGLGLPIEGHTWTDRKNWGYRSYEDRAALTDAYVALIDQLRLLIGRGLSAAVYTQTTDVEIEVNGLMTYDRAIIKPDAERVTAANRKLYLPPPIVKTVIETSEQSGQTWHYTTEKPADDWMQPTFDDAQWSSGPGGFGRAGTPGAVIGTPWTSDDIWLRRRVELPERKFLSPYLRIHHDEDATVYVNGVKAADLQGWTVDYALIPLAAEARAALRPGANTIAVHCHQTNGGQYIDVGLAEVREAGKE